MMSFYELQNYKVGDVITKMVHWTNGGTYTQWDNNGRKYCYNFVCKNVTEEGEPAYECEIVVEMI